MSTDLGIRGRKDSLKEDVKKAATDASTSPAMETLTRLGYLVRGTVYAVMGLLALKVVLGRGGALTDTQGAIAALGQTPFGAGLLYIVLIGLIGYGLSGLTRAAIDTRHKGTDIKGIVERVGYAGSGISYLLLGLATFNLIQGQASAAQNGAQTAEIRQTTSTILAQPLGAWWVALAALIAIGVGIYQTYSGVRSDLGQQLKPYAVSSGQRQWIIRLGRFGVAARGLVFTLVGLFLFLAAYYHDPRQAKGMDGVLASLLQQPYGPWLLAVVALGLLAFGFYSALSGLWLRIER